jgi:threonine/homoserine/homoserine lactone efflux protein
MDPTTVAFLGVALVIVVTPGPDMALVTRNTLLGGREAGVRTVAGIIVGMGFWTLASAVGVAAILAASATAFLALKLAGGAYLVWLGWRTIRGELAHGSALNADTNASASTAPTRPYLLQGFASAALNPKLGVLFITLLPQFVRPGDPALRSVELAGLFALIGLVWLLALVEFLSRARRLAAMPRLSRAVRLASGSILIALGIRVALSQE